MAAKQNDDCDLWSERAVHSDPGVRPWDTDRRYGASSSAMSTGAAVAERDERRMQL